MTDSGATTITNTAMARENKILPFRYFGAQYRSFEFINKRLPRTDGYVEPFGGAATVLVNRDPVHLEVYNDLDGMAVSFFKALRDCPDELVESLEQTPYSRSEFEGAVERRDGSEDLDLIERARTFFILAQQGRYAHTPTTRTKGEWARSVNPQDPRISQPVIYRRKIDQLRELADRLQGVHLENTDGIDLIETYDSPETTFYVDPPYVAETRGDGSAYGDLDMNEKNHRRLAETLNSVDGYVAVSGYESELYDELFDGWFVYRADAKVNTNGSAEGKENREVLWTNYDPEEAVAEHSNQASLDSTEWGTVND